MAITSLQQLQIAASQQYNVQSSRDGTSVTSLRLNPTAYGLSSQTQAVATPALVNTAVTVTSVTGTVSSFTVAGSTVILVEGPQGPQGAQGPQGNQGVQGAAGLDLNPIPNMSNRAGEYLTNDGQGGLAWHDLSADLSVQLAHVRRQQLINTIVFGS